MLAPTNDGRRRIVPKTKISTLSSKVTGSSRVDYRYADISSRCPEVPCLDSSSNRLDLGRFDSSSGCGELGLRKDEDATKSSHCSLVSEDTAIRSGVKEAAFHILILKECLTTNHWRVL